MAIMLKSVTPVPITAQVAHSRCAKTDGNLAVIGSIQAVRDKLDVLRRASMSPIRRMIRAQRPRARWNKNASG